MPAAARSARWAGPTAAMVGALVVATAMASGAVIGVGHGTEMLGAVALVAMWAPVIVRWERGLYGLLAYLPFAGAVCVAFYPARLPLLLKDILFVVPAYVGLFVAFAAGRVRLRIPGVPLALMGALAVLSIGLTFGPGVANGLMAAIGLKVWLFYLPLYILAYAAVREAADLWRIMRLLTVLASVPCAIGLTQYALALSFGYPEMMTAIYGELAIEMTQGFTAFQVGPGRLMRIPSTFSFVSQYWGFTLAMLVPCYAVWRGDPSPVWRRVGGLIFLLVLAAGTLCGSRAAFVFIPLLLALTVLLERRVRVVVICAATVVPAAVVAAAGLGFRSLFDHLFGLVGHYLRTIAYDGLIEAATSAPLGAGTGTNTGPARYALSDPSMFQVIESYYAKVIYELGLPGLLLVVALFGWIIWSGWRATRHAREELRACAAGLTAFVICLTLNSFKGWQLDLDPVNVYFWVFAGILCRLGTLDLVPASRTVVTGHNGRGRRADGVDDGLMMPRIRGGATLADDPWMPERWRA